MPRFYRFPAAYAAQLARVLEQAESEIALDADMRETDRKIAQMLGRESRTIPLIPDALVDPSRVGVVVLAIADMSNPDDRGITIADVQQRASA